MENWSCPISGGDLFALFKQPVSKENMVIYNQNCGTVPHVQPMHQRWAASPTNVIPELSLLALQKMFVRHGNHVMSRLAWRSSLCGWSARELVRVTRTGEAAEAARQNRLARCLSSIDSLTSKELWTAVSLKLALDSFLNAALPLKRLYKVMPLCARNDVALCKECHSLRLRTHIAVQGMYSDVETCLLIYKSLETRVPRVAPFSDKPWQTHHV